MDTPVDTLQHYHVSSAGPTATNTTTRHYCYCYCDHLQSERRGFDFPQKGIFLSVTIFRSTVWPALPHIQWTISVTSGPCHSSGGLFTASHRGDPGSIPSKAMWDLCRQSGTAEGFPYQPSFHQMLHTHISAGIGTIGLLVAYVPSGLSLTPPHELKKWSP
jgi:hypothetical protein